MKRGGFEPKAWAHGNSVVRKHTLGLGDATAGRSLGGATTLEEAWGVATTLPQEGFWTRRQHRRKRLGARLGPSGHERTPEQDRSESLWPRIGRESGVRMKKNPICCSFSPGSRNRVKASTALSRHYAEGPDGYTRRVLLKLQQIAIRCIRQGGTGAR